VLSAAFKRVAWRTVRTPWQKPPHCSRLYVKNLAVRIWRRSGINCGNFGGTNAGNRALLIVAIFCLDRAPRRDHPFTALADDPTHPCLARRTSIRIPRQRKAPTLEKRNLPSAKPPIASSNKLAATVRPVRPRKVPTLANTGHACGGVSRNRALPRKL
jgi:hypothetical protein